MRCYSKRPFFLSPLAHWRWPLAHFVKAPHAVHVAFYLASLLHLLYLYLFFFIAHFLAAALDELPTYFLTKVVGTYFFCCAFLFRPTCSWL